jgi:hypothetical protein
MQPSQNLTEPYPDGCTCAFPPPGRGRQPSVVTPAVAKGLVHRAVLILVSSKLDESLAFDAEHMGFVRMAAS